MKNSLKSTPTSTAAASSSSLSLRRPINPPPHRLVFEPVATSVSKVYQPGIHQNYPPTATSTATSIATSSSTATRCCRRDHPPDASVSARGIVYMLHGWAQNVYVFSNRAKKLTKRLNKAGYRVIFLQGPHRLPPTVVATEQQVQERPQSGDSETISKNNNNADAVSSFSFSREYAYAWFFYDNDHDHDHENNNDNDNDKIDTTTTTTTTTTAQPPLLLPSPTGKYRGMDRSLTLIRNELQADRINEFERCNNSSPMSISTIIPPSTPVFILEFSQGAVLVHKIATLACISGDGGGGACACDCDDDHYNVPSIHTESSEASSSSSSSPSSSSSFKCGCWSDIRKCILVSGFSFNASISKTNNNNNNNNDDDDEDDDYDGNPSRNVGSGSGGRRKTIPSFHVVGNKDSRVSPHLTRELYSLELCFGGDNGDGDGGDGDGGDANANCDAYTGSSSSSSLSIGEKTQRELWEHDRGHVLPQDRAFCNRLLEFLAVE